ncbi:MAG: hypothetical protein B7Z76_07845 [Acidiphilium sp. 20-67-58]|nr:MAG: hypothetical protein B7Z76_07845 [Acidiphilium sp. 20-67-58]
MTGNLTTDLFQPPSGAVADWSAAWNWSGASVPGAGGTAEIDGASALVDPGVTIANTLRLDGQQATAGLTGNGGAITLAAAARLDIAGHVDLYACDEIMAAGAMTLEGGSSADVVVDIGALTGLPGAAAPQFTNAGTITVGTGATLSVGGTAFDNAGAVNLAGGTLVVDGGALSGGGTIALGDGTSVRVTDAVSSQTFEFGPGRATLTLADPFLGANVTIGGLSGNDAILLPSLAGGSIRESGATVSLLDAQGHVEGRFISADAAPLFATTGPGGLSLTAGIATETATATTSTNPPCYARGTMILTPNGLRPVETLAAGDRVVTAAGHVVPVIWTGSRVLDLTAHPAPEQVQPISFAAGSLAPGLPARRLRLSPDHALLLDGVLVPARFLVNGATICREEACLAISYHHVELVRHDLLLAEGAPCESYLDTGNRAGFAASETCVVRGLNWDRDACAPLCTGGARLRAIRETLHARAQALGFMVETSDDAALWAGGAVMPLVPGEWIALPPGHGGKAFLHSSRFVPGCVDPASDDRRQLGVALAELRTETGPLDIAASAVRGFHPQAPGDQAIWSTGHGELRLPAGATRLFVRLAAFPQLWRRVESAVGSGVEAVHLCRF